MNSMGARSFVLAAVAVVLAGCTSGSSTVSITVTPSAPFSASPGEPAWTTYHRDGARTGFDPSSPALGSVRQAWTSPALDGDVYAEPLVLGGRVFVATEDDSVYALDAATGSVVWRSHLG